MKKTEITVRYSTGDKKVLADVYGSLCIHKSIDYITAYTITHVATGLKLVNAKTRKGAKEALTDFLNVYDFNFKTQEEFSKISLDLKNKILPIVAKYRY